MNKKYIYILNKLKNVVSKLRSTPDKGEGVGREYKYTGQAASDFIRQLLISGKPAMIARFGSVELDCLTTYYLKTHRSSLKNSYRYITGKGDRFWWTQELIDQMGNNAGFFPPTIANLEKFSEQMLEDMKEIDVLGAWLDKEKYFDDRLLEVVKIKLEDIEPYYHTSPWTKALEGKKILVIHPYAASIQSQYEKREKLFENKETLPAFKLITLKAVQSIGGSETEHADWFVALNNMKERIHRINFDIALIGCGAYGFPLAAHIKRMGKQAVHLGGATQILFGIKGKRWEEMSFFKELFNEYWIRPSIEETPKNSTKIENGCYW